MPFDRAVTITTNNKPRRLLDWCDLTTKEWAEFDYLGNPYDDTDRRFFRYMGCVYDTHEFSTCSSVGAPNDFLGYHGYQSDSYFSGVLIRYTNGYEDVIVARYCA